MDAYGELEARLRRALGPGVCVAAGAIADAERAGADPDEALHPSERAQVEGAVPERRRAFAAGRRLARRLLAALGHPDTPIPSSPEGAPRWPPGLTGSLSHTTALAVAVLAPLDVAGGLGVDAEEDAPLDRGTWPLLLRPRERERLEAGGRSEAERGRHAKLVFSAKEAVYKCQFPLTGALLDFPDVELERWPTADDGAFTARILHPSSAADPRLRAPLAGVCLRVAPWIVTAIALPPAASGRGAPQGQGSPLFGSGSSS